MRSSACQPNAQPRQTLERAAGEHPSRVRLPQRQSQLPDRPHAALACVPSRCTTSGRAAPVDASLPLSPSRRSLLPTAPSGSLPADRSRDRSSARAIGRAMRASLRVSPKKGDAGANGAYGRDGQDPRAAAREKWMYSHRRLPATSEAEPSAPRSPSRCGFLQIASAIPRPPASRESHRPSR